MVSRAQPMPRNGPARPNGAPAGLVGARQQPDVVNDKWLSNGTLLLGRRGSKDWDPEGKFRTRSPLSPASVLPGSHPRSTTSQRVEEFMRPRPTVETAVVAGAMLVVLLRPVPSPRSADLSRHRRAQPSHGSSAAAMPSATTASAPVSVTMAGALAYPIPITGPFLAPGSKPGRPSGPGHRRGRRQQSPRDHRPAGSDANGSSPTGGSRTRPELHTS